MHYRLGRRPSVYAVSLNDGVWRFWHDAPGLSQRFTGTSGDGGDTISGLSQLSRDGSTSDDLEITYRRVLQR